MTPIMVKQLLQGHTQFLERYVHNEREFLQKLASEGQSPGALYVGCSDSRVIPELLTATAPGELFVVRNVANLVPPLEHQDASVGAVLEYGVDVLGVTDVIVCGHYGCGGVLAALRRLEGTEKLPSLREWLQDTVAVAERARSLYPDEASQWRAAVELNVLAQIEHLATFEPLRRRFEQGQLHAHAWVYDSHTCDLHVWNAGEFRLARTLL